MVEVAETSSDAGEPGAPPGSRSIKGALRETFASLSSVFKNPNLRKVQLALAGSMIGDWAYGTAVAVWAYGVGGATAVGVWTAIRMALLALTSPIGATFADRYSRRAVMITADIVRAVLVVLAVVCLYLDLHPAFVFVLATLTSIASTAFRPAQRALMPSLANRPEELTASNGTSSTLESLAFFVGPSIGALLLVVADVEVVFLLNVLTFVWSMLMIMRIQVPGREPEDTEPADGSDPGEDEPKEKFLTEVSAGFRSIWNDKDLLVVTAEVAAQTIVAGASAVFTVVMAVHILGTGPEGVGYLDSMFGVGAIVGGFVAISRASRLKLAQDMTYGVVLWSVPLLLVTAWPTPPVAFAAVVLLGFGNPLVDVNMETILMRITPEAVLGRVFGALEACLIATMALGAAVMPALVHWLGLRGALAVVGIGVAVLALIGLPRMRGLDSRLRRPAFLDRLEAVPMFAPLTPAVLESLARSLITVPVAAGEVVLREGEDSDRFYVIDSGLVEVTQEGTVVRREGPGDFFGEIGLLRDVPRTATITAVEDSVLVALEREDFLSAVTGEREARTAADEVVNRRLMRA
ncbi:MAG: MFS transporter [Nocardioides sp.]